MRPCPSTGTNPPGSTQCAEARRRQGAKVIGEECTDARLRSIADTLGGDIIERDGGVAIVVDRFYPADHQHGLLRIGDVPGCALASAPELSLLGGVPEPLDRAPRALLFVDLETTGLAGGAGTYAFLVGCAFFEPHGFRIRQYFLPGISTSGGSSRRSRRLCASRPRW